MNKDYKEILSKLKKYQTLFIILIPIFLAIFFRAYTYELPITEDWASSTLENNLKNNIRSQLVSSYPNISQQDLENLVNQNYNQILQENSEAIQQQKESLIQELKNNFQDEDGQTYLLAIDPYYYLRYAENILENGHQGDELVDGRPYDNHMYAPSGNYIAPSLHPYLIAITHKISSLFGNDSVNKAAFILPLLISALAIIPCFFLTRKIAGNTGGFVASVILATHPAFLGRTPAGFSDTDAYTILFPLLIVWLLFESWITKKPKKKIMFAGLAGLATGLFSFAWIGWWHIFDVILGAIGVYFIFLLLKYKKQIFEKKISKRFLQSSITYILSSTLFVSILVGFSQLINATINGPISFVFLKRAVHPSLWPNVFTTVAELNEISLQGIVSNIGNMSLLFISALGAIFVLMNKKNFKINLKYFLVLLFWFLVTFYASTKGIRFIILLVPIYCVGLGISVGTVYRKIKIWIGKNLDINKSLTTITLIFILSISMIPLIDKANDIARNEVPSIDDTWYSVLTNIKENTPEETIISSWWDFGHWFKQIADRRVTFDGGSQNTPRAHWIGKALLTNNEKESIGILRMLDCGGDEAFEVIEKETGSTLKSVNILYEIFTKEKEEATEILKNYGLNSENIIEKTHCQPPEAVVITSEDMVSKSGVWSHFGSWDFIKSFVYNNIKERSKSEAIELILEDTNLSEEEANDMYNEAIGLSGDEANSWISGFYSYQYRSKCVVRDNLLSCENSAVDLNKKIAYIGTGDGEFAALKYYIDQEGVHVNEEGYDLALINNEKKVAIASPILMDSIFTKLFFFNGNSLNNFELFDHQRGFNNFDIYVWKVKWQ